MSGRLKILLITIIAIVSSFYSVAAFAETFSGKEVMQMSTELATQIEALSSALPEPVQISSTKRTIKVEDTLYLMAKWLELYGDSNTIPDEVPFLETKRPAKIINSVTTGQMDTESLLKAGHDVASALENDPRIPPSFKVMVSGTGNMAEADMGMDTLIFIFARTIRWVESNQSMPVYASVKKMTPPASWIRPEFSLKESFLSYTNDLDSPADEISFKLGLGFLSRSITAYYPAMITSIQNQDSLEYGTDPDDRWELKFRLKENSFRYTNNMNSFDGLPQDPFYAHYNGFDSEVATYEFYRVGTNLLNTGIQLHQAETASNKYFLNSATHIFGAYKFNAVYAERQGLDLDQISENIIGWLEGPVPGFNGKGTLNVGYIHSDNDFPKYGTNLGDNYDNFNGSGNGIRLAVKDVGFGRFTMEGSHLQTDHNLTSYWADGVESGSFVGSGRVYDYGKVSTHVKLFAQDITVSLITSQETNDLFIPDNFTYPDPDDPEASDFEPPDEKNKRPSEEAIIKLLFEVQPVSSLKLYTSIQTSESYVERISTGTNLLGSNTQLAGGLQKDFAQYRLNVDAQYNMGYTYDWHHQEFVIPNGSVYAKAENSKIPLAPILAAYYQYNDDFGPADLRLYGRIKGTINSKWSTNVAFLDCEKSSDSTKDGWYTYAGFTFQSGATTINTGYLIREQDRLYFDITQKLAMLKLSLVYGVDKGLGDSGSRDNFVADDGRPWEALMGSKNSGTDPQYTFKLSMAF